MRVRRKTGLRVLEVEVVTTLADHIRTLNVQSFHVDGELKALAEIDTAARELLDDYDAACVNWSDVRRRGSPNGFGRSLST